MRATHQARGDLKTKTVIMGRSSTELRPALPPCSTYRGGGSPAKPRCPRGGLTKHDPDCPICARSCGFGADFEFADPNLLHNQWRRDEIAALLGLWTPTKVAAAYPIQDPVEVNYARIRNLTSSLIETALVSCAIITLETPEANELP